QLSLRNDQINIHIMFESRILFIVGVVFIRVKGQTINNHASYGISEQIQSSIHNLNGENPCPNAEDIAPCICSANVSGAGDFRQEMKCANISDSEELTRIFQSTMPVTNFTSLYIHDSDISGLHNGVFGDVTFEEVDIECHSLNAVEEDVFINMWPTLIHLNIYHGILEDFPYKTLVNSKSLTSLNVYSNNIGVILPISNSNLEWISISYNPITELPKGTFQELPHLYAFQISHTNISELPDDFLCGNDDLAWVDLSFNNIQHISSGTFNITSSDLSLIELGHNSITSLDVDAFIFPASREGLLMLNLFFNNISVLPEEVWRPLLEQDVQIDLFENNLDCGCDIAWLVLDDSLMQSHRLNRAQCYNGTSIEDLDQSYYLENC
ncbi:unnamed protein product, partial [Meganyctiphanes norvegica]